MQDSSGSGLFSNAQNLVINGGIFVSLSWADLAIILNFSIYQNNVNICPTDRQMKIPMLQKPNSSLIFTGRKDILNKLGKIFAPRANSRQMSRCSCLLLGLGGIGKTQICLKFTEENSERQVFLYCYPNYGIYILF